MPETSIPLGDYEQYFRQILNDPSLKWNAGQIATGTLTSLARTNGTPNTFFNLDTGQLVTSSGTFSGGIVTGTVSVGTNSIILDGTNRRIVVNDGTTNRLLIGFGSALF